MRVPVPQTNAVRRGDFGRLGHGDALDVFIPRPVSALAGQRVAAVACGDTHTLVLLDQGKLLAFGRGQNGQLGLGRREDSLAPQEVTTLSGSEVVGIACGAEHSLCVTATGKAYAWGWGRYGNLGSGTNHDQCAPLSPVPSVCTHTQLPQLPAKQSRSVL